MKFVVLKYKILFAQSYFIKKKENTVFNNITLHIQDNSYRRLKTRSANRQIPLKIALSEHEF